LVLNEIGDGPVVSSQPVVSYKADSPLMGDEITIVKDPELEGNSHLIQESECACNIWLALSII